jgi:hypothetical protein
MTFDGRSEPGRTRNDRLVRVVAHPPNPGGLVDVDAVGTGRERETA